MKEMVTVLNINNLNKAKTITTSLKVAEYFSRRHDNVLRDIEKLECSKDFFLLNFEEIIFDSKIKKAYNITKNGFMFLVMGFTGKKAAEIKEAFINEFDKNENLIKILINQQRDEEWQKVRKESKRIRLEETDEIKRLVEYAKENGSKNADKYYTHFSKLIWHYLFEVDKDYKDVKNKRDLLNTNQLHVAMQGEYIIKNKIDEGIGRKIDYHDIYNNARDDIKNFSNFIEITKIPHFEQLSLFC